LNFKADLRGTVGVSAALSTTPREWQLMAADILTLPAGVDNAFGILTKDLDLIPDD